MNPDNKLNINLVYQNKKTTSTDKFLITSSVVLNPPSYRNTSMKAEMTVTNISGYDVVPSWDGHRELAEQWELFGISSMHVADNLTGTLPSWYDDLDPDHNYVGVTNDHDYMNDGYSVNGLLYVSTHDVKTIIAGLKSIDLDHDTCPHVNVPNYSWYKELVLLDQVADCVKCKHLYQPKRSHFIELISCDGITKKKENLKWAANYNRNDTNMVVMAGYGGVLF